MYPRSCLMTGCRRAALPLAFSVLLLPVPAAQAQRLLTLVPGVGQAASAGDLGPSIGPAPTAVQVDLELLRGAPPRLEVPTPEGDVLSAVQSVFEDRGGGDLMWSGGQPDAGYDTVVLTVEGGRLVGRFGAAAAGVYQIHAERDGRGGMAPVVGPRPDGSEPWCAVEAGAEGAHYAHAHARAGAADLPERVSNPQSHDRLDILVAYTATAAANWADRGGALAAIRHAGDYLKMVFRNNDLPVEPHIVHVAQASTALDRAGKDLGWHPDPVYNYSLTRWMDLDIDLKLLRHEHRADLVHLFTGAHHRLLEGACGGHSLLKKGYTGQQFSSVARGWTTNHPAVCRDYATTFAHEIGHGLGAHHDRANLVGFLAPGYAEELASLFRPYSLGHANFDVMPSLGTAMSYPGQTEPFFSTPRIRPYGAVVGVADEHDNERTLRETVHIGVQYSDYLRSLEGVPAPPSDFQVRFDGSVARLSWRDNAPDAGGYEVAYLWFPDTPGYFESRRQAVEGRSGATLSLEYTEPGTSYSFLVAATKGEVRSLQSRVDLLFPGEPVEPPSGVSVTVSRSLECNVRWTDNSDNESGFDVELLQGGEPIARQRHVADGERAFFSAYKLLPQVGAEYGVRVFAYNSSGWSESSEVATFRWEHPLAPGPVADVAARAIGSTTVRVTWTPDPEVELYLVGARLRGWAHLRRWRPSRDGPASAAWVDFEGLPRGGRYKFSVGPWGGLDSYTYLTLDERGPGPEAPSDLSWAREEGETVLSWKDNSSDELGFEIQSAPIGTEFWGRAVTVPPDTESVAYGRSRGHVLRVFAYNERGFSLSSPSVPEPLTILSLTAASGAMEVALAWRVAFAETVTRIQVRWKAAADLPFDDAVDAWTDLPAAVREYTVTGLRNSTEYTFAVRAAAAWGRGTASIVWATPRDLPSPPRVPPKASFTVSADCSDDPCGVRTGEEIRFTDTSTGEVTERNWDFGDGATSDLRSPTHAWSSPGFYDVTLTVGDGSSSASATRTVLVADRRLAASFRLDIPCDEDLCRTLTDAPVSFVDTSGGNVTEWRWSFGDGAASDLRSPTHAWSTPGFYDVTLTVSDGSSSDSATRTLLVEAAAPAGSCGFDEETTCLQDSRFEVKANWWSADGESGPGRVVYAGTNDSGLFRFFDPLNWEILIKVLDGCGINGRMWVLGAATTDLGYRIQVTDTVSGESRSYANEPGQPALAIVDTEAFSLPCGGGAGP